MEGRDLKEDAAARARVSALGAPYAWVETLDDPRLDAFARLTEVQLRNKLEPEKGVFIAESIKVIDRALDAGMIPVSVLMTPEWLDAAAPTVARIQKASKPAPTLRGGVSGGGVSARAASCGGDDAEGSSACTPVFVAPVEKLKRLTGFALTRGILCAMRRPKLPSVEELLAGVRPGGARRIAVLEGIVDHTNVGAIFRSAAALGVDAVLVAPTCCDPLYRRSVRVSMGTVFQVPWTRIGNDAHDWPRAGLEELHRLGYVTAAMALSDDSIPLDDARLAACERLALVFGTEGDGLTARTIEGCDYTVRIPMAHHVDSLNVAAASAVAFWELCR